MLSRSPRSWPTRPRATTSRGMRSSRASAPRAPYSTRTSDGIDRPEVRGKLARQRRAHSPRRGADPANPGGGHRRGGRGERHGRYAGRAASACALQAPRCEIYTDVDGVYTADPRVVPEARLLPEISYEEMLELAQMGARVMHPRAVELGELYGMPIEVRSSFHDRPGTLIHRG